jgi:hypothetical protein
MAGAVVHRVAPERRAPRPQEGSPGAAPQARLPPVLDRLRSCRARITRIGRRPGRWSPPRAPASRRRPGRPGARGVASARRAPRAARPGSAPRPPGSVAGRDRRERLRGHRRVAARLSAVAAAKRGVDHVEHLPDQHLLVGRQGAGLGDGAVCAPTRTLGRHGAPCCRPPTHRRPRRATPSAGGDPRASGRGAACSKAADHR